MYDLGSFEDELADLWLLEFTKDGLCCLCGNSGRVDTRGKALNAKGVDLGDIRYCICPNGRCAKRAGLPLDRT